MTGESLRKQFESEPKGFRPIMTYYAEWLENKLIAQQKDVDFLRCLEAAGVDNWDGYDIAQDYMEDGEY